MKRTPVAQKIVARILNWDYMKLKSSAKQGNQLSQYSAYKVGENLNHLYTWKGLISRIYKVLQKLSVKAQVRKQSSKRSTNGQ